MAKIRFKIVTPEKVVFECEADQATIPTQNGEITVLPGHIPLLSLLYPGKISLVVNGKEELMAVSGGFIEVKGKSELVILADTAERAEEIDIEKAEEAKRRAELLLKEMKNRDNVDYTALAVKIEKELARLKVARRRQYGSANLNINKKD